MKARLGSGVRFKALSNKLSAKGATSPDALAAWIGRKKYGAKKFGKLSAMGKKKNMPGMSEHMMVNCSSHLRKKSIPMGM